MPPVMQEDETVPPVRQPSTLLAPMSIVTTATRWVWKNYSAWVNWFPSG